MKVQDGLFSRTLVIEDTSHGGLEEEVLRNKGLHEQIRGLFPRFEAAVRLEMGLRGEVSLRTFASPVGEVRLFAAMKR